MNYKIIKCTQLDRLADYDTSCEYCHNRKGKDHRPWCPTKNDDIDIANNANKILNMEYGDL